MDRRRAAGSGAPCACGCARRARARARGCAGQRAHEGRVCLAAQRLGQADHRRPAGPDLGRQRRHGPARVRRHRQVPGTDGVRLHEHRDDRAEDVGPASGRRGHRVCPARRARHLLLALARSGPAGDRPCQPCQLLCARTGRIEEHELHDPGSRGQTGHRQPGLPSAGRRHRPDRGRAQEAPGRRRHCAVAPAARSVRLEGRRLVLVGPHTRRRRAPVPGLHPAVAAHV
jgi:hypothetical protein